MKQRKDENEKYTVLMASDAAAKELLELRKVPQSEAQPTWMMRAMALSHRAHPLESVAAYSKKSEESNGIIVQSPSTTT